MHASEALRRTPLHDRHLAAGARMVPFAGWEMPVQYEGVIPEHRAVREHAGIFDVSHMGQLEVRGPARARVPSDDALERPEPDRHGPGAVHAASRRERLPDRRPDRLPARRRPPAARRQRARGSMPTATGSRPGPGTARSSTTAHPTWRCSRFRGRRPWIWSSCRELEPFEFTARRGVRRPRHRRPHRLHRRAGRRDHGGARQGRAALGQAASPPARLRPGWARATRSGSRSAIRSTATTCRRARTALEAGWAGCARSTARSSSAPPALRAQREQGGYDRLVAFRMSGRGHPAPGHGHPARRRGDQRHDVADARGRDRDGVRPRRPRRRRHRDRDRRARAARSPPAWPPSPCT